MVGGKEDEGQIDGGSADLHQDGIREIAGGGFRIGLARECGRELERDWSGRVCGIGHYGTTDFPTVDDRLDPWVHPFRTVLGQLLIIAPQVGMVVVELRQEIV